MNFDAPSGLKKGDRVRVPKGASFTSTHPQRKRGVLTRAQVVTVHHITDAEVRVVGYYTKYRDGSEGFYFNQNESDLKHLCYRLGLPENDAGIAMIETEALKHQTDPYGHGTSFECRIQVSPEKVCWPGSGGYWVEAPALLCEKVS